MSDTPYALDIARTFGATPKRVDRTALVVRGEPHRPGTAEPDHQVWATTTSGRR